MRNIKKIIETMYSEGKKGGAPVFKIDKLTRKNPYKGLIFTILSSRTKDETTLKACEKLFSIAKSIEGLKRAPVKKIERAIFGVGFYKTKAKNLKKLAEVLERDFKGKIPSTFEDLIKLPGVGRKTANVVLAHTFGKDAIGVDVHVHRISNRLGLVKTKKPEETEEQLRKIIEKKYWKKINIAMVSYGQTICSPKKPKCEICKLNKICPKIGV